MITLSPPTDSFDVIGTSFLDRTCLPRQINSTNSPCPRGPFKIIYGLFTFNFSGTLWSCVNGLTDVAFSTFYKSRDLIVCNDHPWMKHVGNTFWSSYMTLPYICIGYGVVEGTLFVCASDSIQVCSVVMVSRYRRSSFIRHAGKCQFTCVTTCKQITL